ncbi:hypothetical protein LUZ60_009860 [Juncus effusus]|nr:hypothetical protein LUZ60_009860 [Juncus effusus]
MAGIRWPPVAEEQAPYGAAAAEQTDEERSSVAADSWSVKSDFGSSTIDFRAASDYSSDKEDVETLQNFCDANYAEDLANFQENNHSNDLWFEGELLEVLVRWTKNLCLNGTDKNLSAFNVLDVGTGSGRLLQELSKQGFSNLVGIDFSEAAIEVARNRANRDGFPNISFSVDDVLETKLEKKFQLVMDRGTLDSIGFHPDGPVKRMMYWESVSRLVAPGGFLVVTSCNSSKDDLIQEIENFNHRKMNPISAANGENNHSTIFEYVDHVQNYPTGVSSGNRVATVAFVRK